MKLKKRMVALMLATAVVLGSAGSYMQVEAKCSGYTEYARGKAFCDNTDGCGFLWLKYTKKHKSYQERYCDKNKRQVRETRALYVKDGCC